MIRPYHLFINHFVYQRHKEQADKCTHGHAYYESKRERVLQRTAHIGTRQQGQNAQNSGERCHDNGTQTAMTGPDNRCECRRATSAQAIDGIYFKNGVINDDAGHHYETDHGHDVQRLACHPRPHPPPFQTG